MTRAKGTERHEKQPAAQKGKGATVVNGKDESVKGKGKGKGKSEK